MEGRDGYYRYASTNWETRKFSGAVINYSQNWFLFSPGVSFGFLVNRFTIKGDIKITPLIFCIGRDDHLLTETLYTDYVFGKIAVEPALDISCTVSPRFDVGLNSSYRFITGSRGDTNNDVYGYDVPAYWTVNSGGAGLQLWEFSLYLKVFFGKR